jgi:hypothetical protein
MGRADWLHFGAGVCVHTYERRGAQMEREGESGEMERFLD